MKKEEKKQSKKEAIVCGKTSFLTLVQTSNDSLHKQFQWMRMRLIHKRASEYWMCLYRFPVALLLIFKPFTPLCKMFTQKGRAMHSLIKVEKQMILKVGSRRKRVFLSYSRSKSNGSILRHFYTIKRINCH